MRRPSSPDPSRFILQVRLLDSTVQLLPEEEPSGEYVTWYEASLVQVGEDEREHIAGSLRGFVIDAERAMNDGADLLMDCDADNGTTVEFADACLTSRGRVKKVVCRSTGLLRDVGNVLGIASVALKPTFRGHRLGLLFVRRFIDRVARGCVLVVCKPEPTQFPVGDVDRKEFLHPETNEQAATTALRRYAEVLGFARVGRTPYFALSLEHVQRSANTLLQVDLPTSTKVALH